MSATTETLLRPFGWPGRAERRRQLSEAHGAVTEARDSHRRAAAVDAEIEYRVEAMTEAVGALVARLQ